METNLRRKTQELLQQINNLQESGGRTEELNQLLKSARTNFEIIKRERNGIIETILRAMGKNSPGVLVCLSYFITECYVPPFYSCFLFCLQKMTQKDRESVVQTFVKDTALRSAKSRSAIQAMQEALNVSESKCKKVSESYRTTHNRLQNALADQQRLEHENRRLTNEVQVLTEQLQQSREEADNLLSKEREENQKEWLRKEAMFKNTIRMLQKQLRVEKNKLKSSTDNESRALQTVHAPVRVGNTIIRPVVDNKSAAPRHVQKPFKQSTVTLQLTNKETGSIKVPSPQQQIEKENAGKVPPPPPPLEGAHKPKRVLGNSSSRMNATALPGKVKAFVRKPQNSGNAQVPPSVGVTNDSSSRLSATSNSKTPSKTRAEIVRENGGIAAMREKVRQLRSPTFK